ncbi:S-methyl-5'-thioadenosine phosphorylase, partial [Pseudomonas sp. HMWF031]
MSNISASPSLDSAKVGVIGGSGLYAIDALEDVREVELE